VAYSGFELVFDLHSENDSSNSRILSKLNMHYHQNKHLLLNCQIQFSLHAKNVSP